MARTSKTPYRGRQEAVFEGKCIEEGVCEDMVKIRKEKKKRKIKIGRIPVAPPTQEHKDKSKYSRKKKHDENLMNDEVK